MDQINSRKQRRTRSFRRKEWRFINEYSVIIYILLFTWNSCAESVNKEIENVNIYSLNNDCHNCPNNRSNTINEINENHTEPQENESDTFLDEMLTIIEVVSQRMISKSNKTEEDIEDEIFQGIDETLKTDYYEIADGIEIQPVKDIETVKENYKLATIKEVSIARMRTDINENESYNTTKRAIFSQFSFERKMLNRIRNFFETHVLSISLPKAARLFGFRSFGLKKLLVPVLIGAQVLKSVLIAMFLPSILGSFGKIVGKGLSHLSASSSQASFPPVMDEPDPYAEGGTTGTGLKDETITGYETDPQGVYAYPQDQQQAMFSATNDVNGLADVTMSRFGPGGAKVSYLPTKNQDYYKNQVATNNYKVFHKIPASSMILSNYDPFYSPLLSRLDGIFARLGLVPNENADVDPHGHSTAKLEACREQLICLMYSSPAKYAPYSNLVSAQLSRELNELRRPTSDNAEILRFFRYMRAARQGQEGADCIRIHPGCATPSEPSHTMISAYHDINKLVTARKLH